MDELAPVEALPPLPPGARFHRFGMLHGWSEDADAADLLRDPRPARSLARWATRAGAAVPTAPPAP